jgi:hypothetical protein
VSAFSRGYAGHRRIDRVLPGLGYAGRSLWRAANLAAAALPGAWLAGTARVLARARPPALRAVAGPGAGA